MPLVDDLGPASQAFPVMGAILAGDRLVLSSRNLAPSMIVELELVGLTVTRTEEVEIGIGAWALAAGTDDVWLGLSGAGRAGNLLRFPLSTGDLHAVAELDANYIWALAIDGTDVVGALDPVAAFRYDPGTDFARLIGPPSAGTTIVRSIAAVAGSVVIGGAAGRTARLERLALDARTDVLPTALAGHRTVYVLAADGARIVAGTRGPDEIDPALAVLDLDDPDAAAVTVLPGESVVDALLVEPDVVHATARPSGALYRWTPGRDAERIGTPVPHGETRALARHRGEVVGVSGDGRVWRTGDDGAFHVTPLTELGVPARPEITQSLYARGGSVHAGGNFGLSTHDLRSGDVRRVFAPGEPKDLVELRGALHLGMYPIGEVWRLDEAGRAEHAFSLAPRQNRPIVLRTDARGDRLLVTSTSDRDGRGALQIWDGETMTPVLDPFGDRGHPAGVVAFEDRILVGSSGADPQLLALDATTLAARWRVTVEGGSTIMGLVVLDGLVWAAGVRGDLTAVDPTDGRLVQRHTIGASGGRLAILEDRLFAATGTALLEIDPATGTSSVVLDDLDGRFWGHVPLAADDEALYVLRGDHILRVRP
jgi:outer membrane protein assembly factor BamB